MVGHSPLTSPPLKVANSGIYIKNSGKKIDGPRLWLQFPQIDTVPLEGVFDVAGVLNKQAMNLKNQHHILNGAAL
jgi:hypothetical protein